MIVLIRQCTKPFCLVAQDMSKRDEESSCSATGNPFGDSDVPDNIVNHILEDGNYSDCDNESDEEDDSDNEMDSPTNSEKDIMKSQLQLDAASDAAKLEEASSSKYARKNIIGSFLR